MSAPEFLRTVLPNGLTIIAERNMEASSFAAGWFVNTGSRDEKPRLAGVSHFLEHMMFKGTERRSASDINREFDELGATYNAYTSEERTVYYGAVLPEAQERLLDLLTDMMRPALRQDDFDVEKNVILEEIAMYEDSPLHRALDLAGPRFFNGHPLGNSILGTAESITALSREEMLGYFTSRYAPNNLVVAAAGRLDWEALVDQLERLTRDWQPATTERSYPEFKPAAGSEKVADPKLQRVHLALYAPAVSAQHELRHAASLVANVLGDPGSGRLHWALTDRGLVDSAMLLFDGADRAGNFISYVSTAPELAEQVSGLLLDELHNIHSDLPTEAEWQAARNKVATALTFGAETPFTRLMSLGSTWLYRQEYVPVSEAVDRVLATGLDEAEQLLASRPFEQSYLLQLGPPESEDGR